MEPAVANRIEATPGTCGGKPRIAGTRIRVQDVVAWHEMQGLSADEIVGGYPHITLADVYASLAYYHANRDEIHRYMREEEEFVRSLRQAALADMDADGSTVSS